MSKTKTVYLVEADNDNMISNWTDCLTVSRNARGRFAVNLSKYGEDAEGGGDRRWRTWDKAVGMKSPAQVFDAIENIADGHGIPLDWAEATTLIAELDWITAGIIAVKAQVQIPDLPDTFDLAQQRSLRALGKVTVGVEWGYEFHELTIRFEDYLDILNGYGFGGETSYYYDGKRFKASWSFGLEEDDPYLDVSYGNDGGTGWSGKLSGVARLEGKSIDGVDLAQLLLKARFPEDSE